MDIGATRKTVRSNKTTPRAKHIVTQLVAGTYPIGAHLRKIGIRVKDICPLCQEGPDELQQGVEQGWFVSDYIQDAQIAGP